MEPQTYVSDLYVCHAGECDFEGEFGSYSWFTPWVVVPAKTRGQAKSLASWKLEADFVNVRCRLWKRDVEVTVLGEKIINPEIHRSEIEEFLAILKLSGSGYYL